MSCSPSWSAFGSDAARRGTGPFPRRSLEAAAVLGALVVSWPVAVAYLAWKLAGYPLLDQGRDALERVRAGRFGEGAFRAAGFGPGGFGGFGPRDFGGFASSPRNAAFEEYRRGELDRLERERRRLDEESRAFAEFVEELKRARDREEFDAFMARRRGEGTPGA